MTALLKHRDKDEYTTVSNLGWLLNHDRDVEVFIVRPYYPYGIDRDIDYYAHCKAVLVALLDHPRYDEFKCLFADYRVLRDWLVRPKFLTIPVEWFGQNLEVGHTLTKGGN